MPEILIAILLVVIAVAIVVVVTAFAKDRRGRWVAPLLVVLLLALAAAIVRTRSCRRPIQAPLRARRPVRARRATRCPGRGLAVGPATPIPSRPSEPGTNAAFAAPRSLTAPYPLPILAAV